MSVPDPSHRARQMFTRNIPMHPAEIPVVEVNEKPCLLGFPRALLKMTEYPVVDGPPVSDTMSACLLIAIPPRAGPAFQSGHSL